jgi:hypothetical protein
MPPNSPSLQAGSVTAPGTAGACESAPSRYDEVSHAPMQAASCPWPRAGSGAVEFCYYAGGGGSCSVARAAQLSRRSSVGVYIHAVRARWGTKSGPGTSKVQAQTGLVRPPCQLLARRNSMPTQTDRGRRARLTSRQAVGFKNPEREPSRTCVCARDTPRSARYCMCVLRPTTKTGS